jgi:hypothetical protein
MNTHYCKVGRIISYSETQINSQETLESIFEIESSNIIFKENLED